MLSSLSSLLRSGGGPSTAAISTVTSAGSSSARTGLGATASAMLGGSSSFTPASSSSSCPNISTSSSSALRVDARGFAKRVGPENMIRTWKIRSGDEVRVNAGKDAEREGRVLQIDKKTNHVKVKGCNLRKVYGKGKQPYVIEKKIHYSNVNLLDPVTREPTRISLVFQPDGGILRVSKKSSTIIPWPDDRKVPMKQGRGRDGPKDTPPAEALKKTYNYHADVQAIQIARASMTKYNHEVGR